LQEREKPSKAKQRIEEGSEREREINHDGYMKPDQKDTVFVTVRVRVQVESELAGRVEILNKEVNHSSTAHEALVAQTCWSDFM
jgi:hypothetical protein